MPVLASGLPEEVVDHVGDFAGVGVDQHHVVVIADPLIGRVGRRQAIGPRIGDPELLGIERRAQIDADAQAAVAIAGNGEK
jgi:hypothetical protein